MNYVYNIINKILKKKNNKNQVIYTNIDTEYIKDISLNNKENKIKLYLYIRYYKNLYYKYTNPAKFNIELYNSTIQQDINDVNDYIFFNKEDYKDSIIDDTPQDISIIEKHILLYVSNRNKFDKNISENKIINKITKIDDLDNYYKINNNVDILYILDMKDKDCFNYCYKETDNTRNIYNIKDILFSAIIKYNDKLVKINLENYQYNNTNILVNKILY